jgi:hypothetical protein
MGRALIATRGQFAQAKDAMLYPGLYDVAVLNPAGHEILIPVTCYPFYFASPAPQKFIVRARRVA